MCLYILVGSIYINWILKKKNARQHFIGNVYVLLLKFKNIDTLNIAIADKLQGNFLIYACTCIFDNIFDANSQTFQVYVFLRLW